VAAVIATPDTTATMQGRALIVISLVMNTLFSSFNDVDLPHSMLVDCCMICCRECGPSHRMTTAAAMMIEFDCIFTCHKSANPKSDHKPTTYLTKYLCQY
jgi:hypothetical protein